MNKSFLSLPICQRAKKLKNLLCIFQKNAKDVDLHFSIISYGSSSYGYNPSNHGKLDDLDFFLIVPRSIDPVSLVDVVQSIFMTKINVQTEHLVAILSNRYDICRMYGQVRGIKIGFRIMCTDTFMSICSQKGSIKPIRNIASIGQSRILKDKEWDLELGKYIPVVYQHAYHRLGNEDILLVLHYCFSKTRNRLGPLARKLLAGTVVYEASKHDIHTKLHHLWELFVCYSLHHKPNLGPSAIVESIFRSERFSPSFKTKLCSLVSDILQDQIS